MAAIVVNESSLTSYRQLVVAGQLEIRVIVDPRQVEWIMSGGVWDDNKVWLDSEVWND